MRTELCVVIFYARKWKQGPNKALQVLEDPSDQASNGRTPNFSAQSECCSCRGGWMSLPDKTPACLDFHLWALQWKFWKNICSNHFLSTLSFSATPTSQDMYEEEKPVQLILSDSLGAAMGSKAAEHLENSKQWAAPALTPRKEDVETMLVSNKPVSTEISFHFLSLLQAEVEHC